MMRLLRPIHVIAFLFTLQALFLAWFVTPLGDLPDESGHYAYVVDMTKGRPLPVLGKPSDGKGEIPMDLWKDFGAPEHHRVNYIVQHPPLYYAIAAVPYSLAKRLTNDKAILAKSARIVSALSLGILVLMTFLAVRATGVNETVATGTSMLLGFIPMTNHLASGISNDMFLTAVCSIATVHLVRFVMLRRIWDAYFCALWLAAAGATKMTAWVLTAAFIGLILFEMRQPLLKWGLHAAGVSALALTSPAWWMHRNYFFFKNPFYVFGSHLTPVAPGYTWIEYLKEQPFFEWMLYHFYGLVGFSGYCLSAKNFEVIRKFCKGTQISRVEGISYQIFVALSVVCVLILLWGLFKSTFSIGKNAPSARVKPESVQMWLNETVVRYGLAASMTWIAIGAGLAISAAGYISSYKLHWQVSFVYQAVEFLLLLASFVGLPLIALNRHSDTRLMAYGPILLMLFFLLLFVQGVKAYVLTGSPHGIQGRYALPFLPLLAVSFAIAISRTRWQGPIVAIVCIALGWAYVNAYVDTIMPFFQLVRL